MQTPQPARIRLPILVLALVVLHVPASAQQTSIPGAISPPMATPRDGQHDLAFEIGTWKTHLRRRVAPLSGSTKWVECDGTTVVRGVWNGRANLAELRARCPSGDFEVLSLRIYNPHSHQWTLNFANSSDGTLAQPTIGEFKDGRGEFLDQESFKGRMILLRFVILQLTPDACRFEQAFSDDGGKTWEVNWIATDTRIKDESNQSN